MLHSRIFLLRRTPYLCILVLLTLAACPNPSGGWNGAPEGDPVVTEAERFFWGRWTRMDTGATYYVSAGAVTIDGGSPIAVTMSSATELSYGTAKLTKESENVARLGSGTLLFRDGGAKRSFSAMISGFAPEAAGSRAQGAGTQPRPGRGKRTNGNNPKDTQEVVGGDDGLLEFADAVVGDPQEIVATPDDPGLPASTVVVEPKYDGEFVGTIPIVAAGGYSFKVVSETTNADGGYLYGNEYREYRLLVTLTNIGTAPCYTYQVKVVPEDAVLAVTPAEYVEGPTYPVFNSMPAGATQTIELTVSYGELVEEWKDARLRMEITDSRTDRTWIDYAVLRFHRRPVPLRIAAAVHSGTEGSQLKGFLIHPDNRSQRFAVDSGSTATLWMPWSRSPYRVVFSGAGAASEMKYSFVAGVESAYIGGAPDLAWVNAYERHGAYTDNDGEESRTLMEDPWTAAKAYLQLDDIDYYELDLGDETKLEGVPATAKWVRSVSLDESGIELSDGFERKLNATIEPADADNRTLRWTSSDSQVASVGEDGTVRAEKPGTVTIRVTSADGGKTASCTVEVIAVSVAEVSVTPESAELYTGTTATLAATVLPVNASDAGVEWESSEPGIASVDANGLVTAKAAGSAAITVRTVDGDRTDTCTVTVRTRDTGIVIVGDDGAPPAVSIYGVPSTVSRGEIFSATVDAPAGAAIAWFIGASEIVGTMGSSVAIDTEALSLGSKVLTARVRIGGATGTASADFVVAEADLVLLAPDRDAWISDARPEFDWKDVEGAVAYRIQIAAQTSFAADGV